MIVNPQSWTDRAGPIPESARQGLSDDEVERYLRICVRIVGLVMGIGILAIGFAIMRQYGWL
jgi:hypothetical protein